jgi:hypothetical protein
MVAEPSVRICKKRLVLNVPVGLPFFPGKPGAPAVHSVGVGCRQGNVNAVAAMAALGSPFKRTSATNIRAVADGHRGEGVL